MRVDPSKKKKKEKKNIYPPKRFGSTQNILNHKKTHAKHFDPSKNIFDIRNPCKSYNPHNMLTYAKNIFDPRNSQNWRKKVIHATHATNAPT